MIKKLLGEKHKISVGVKWFETDDPSAAQKYASNSNKYRLEEKNILDFGFKKIDVPEHISVEMEGLGYQRVAVLRNTTIGRAKNHVIFVDIKAY